MKIQLGGHSVIEYGWMDVIIKGREIRIETTESGDGCFDSITIMEEEDEIFLEEEGIIIDEDFSSELYNAWQKYCNS